MKAVPETRYARSGDVNIAYQVLGNGSRDIVVAPGAFSHLEALWDEPVYVRFVERLASFARLMLFDKRGTGLSDRVPNAELPTIEQRMDDMRAAIFGVSEGGRMAAVFATTYPERTQALVMYGTYARRLKTPDYPWAPTGN